MKTDRTGLHLAVLAFNGVNALDLTGPFEVFATAADILAREQKKSAAFRCALIGLDDKPIQSEFGLIFTPHYDLANCPPIKTLIIPGGRGLREPAINAAVANWLQKNADKIPRIGSVCTGIYGLAAAGLLDQRRVTTHWNFAADVAQKFPSLQMDADAIYIRDGKFYTSAGITAGIDLALALVEEDFGARIALAVARDLVVYLRRSGGQSQYSEPLQFQTKSRDAFGDLIAWLHANLSRDLSNAVLAARMGLSERQFNRRFHEQFACTPAYYVETLRLNEARQRLAQTHVSIDVIATSVGFRSADVFRRAFLRRFGLAPSAYQHHFGEPLAAHSIMEKSK